MNDRIQKTDEILDILIDLGYNEVQKAKARNFFSKELVEALGIIISLTNGKYNDK